MKYVFLKSCALALWVIVPQAHANERSEIREAIECLPAKDIVKFFSKFDKLKPEQRDTVDAVMTARFDVTDEGTLPDRVFFRNEGVDTAFEILPDGAVPEFPSISKMDKAGQLCVEDNARAGLNREEDGIQFDVDFDVKFKNESGTYTLAELRDGAKDGKSFYKKLVPAPVKLLIPKMTHVSITFDAPSEGQKISALAGGTELEGLVIEPFGETYVVELDHLDALGADTLAVTGGPFIIEPSPSIEKMRKLGFSEDESEAQNEKEALKE